MPPRKLIPIGDKRILREKLVAAVGPALAKHGFVDIRAEHVAEVAGLNPGIIFRHFGGLRNLVAAYAQTNAAWPSLEELLGGGQQGALGMPPGVQMAQVFRNYVEAMKDRPHTQAILAWEATQKNDLTQELEAVRVRRSLEVFEEIQGEFPPEVDLSALVAVMAGAFLYFAIRAAQGGAFGGIDLGSDKGWERVADTFQLMIERTLQTGA